MKLVMYDVAIIGGGPAGSTAAALLARAGRRVIVFEREKFPRFHIGESLLPFSMKAFTRLGLHEKFLSAGFLKKYGGEIMGACSDSGTKFYFKDGYRSQTRASTCRCDPMGRLVQSKRVTLSMPADALRCSEGNSRSRRPTSIFKSFRSSRITMVCGV